MRIDSSNSSTHEERHRLAGCMYLERRHPADGSGLNVRKNPVGGFELVLRYRFQHDRNENSTQDLCTLLPALVLNIACAIFVLTRDPTGEPFKGERYGAQV